MKTHDATKKAAFLSTLVCVWQWTIYGRVFPWLCQKLVPHSSVAQMSLQVVLDQIIVFPAVYFPLFYGIQAAVDPRSSVTDGMQQWRQNLSEVKTP